MNKVKITAVRQTVYHDLMAQYENAIEHACDMHVGQTWVSVNGQRPQVMVSRISAKPQVVDIRVPNGAYAETPNRGQSQFSAKPQTVDGAGFQQTPFCGHSRAGMFLV